MCDLDNCSAEALTASCRAQSIDVNEWRETRNALLQDAACRFVDLLALHMNCAVSLQQENCQDFPACYEMCGSTWQDEPYADIAIFRGNVWEVANQSCNSLASAVAAVIGSDVGLV